MHYHRPIQYCFHYNNTHWFPAWSHVPDLSIHTQKPRQRYPNNSHASTSLEYLSSIALILFEFLPGAWCCDTYGQHIDAKYWPRTAQAMSLSLYRAQKVSSHLASLVEEEGHFILKKYIHWDLGADLEFASFRLLSLEVRKLSWSDLPKVYAASHNKG